MKRKFGVSILSAMLIPLMLVGCNSKQPAQSRPAQSSERNNSSSGASPSNSVAENSSDIAVESSASTSDISSPQEPSSDLPVVYMTTEISADSLIDVYKALGASPSGKIAVKLSTGEPGSNYLRTDLIGDLVKSFDDPTIVECNTAYGGSRSNTAMHYQVAKDHGYTDIANVDIMDEDGSMTLPVTGGSMWSGEQDAFLESMAEAGKSVVDYLHGNILYINVMNRLSVDCDCDNSPSEPDMHDIGILASFDPVALDQACVDLVYKAEDGQSLINRIESRNGIHTLEQGEKIGLGSRQYNLVSID